MDKGKELIFIKTSKTIVEEYLKKEDWRVRENSNSPFSYGGLGKHITGEVSKDYWLREVYPAYITDEYLNGHMHIHDLNTLSLYTYYGKEVVIAKSIDNNIKLISFEDLYNLFKDNEICVNSADDVWQVEVPSGWKVLDKTGWTNMTVLTRKKKHCSMNFIKNEFGRSVIVTENHPMITQTGEKPSNEICIDTDDLYSADIPALLEKENLFSIDKLDLLKLLPDYIGKDKVYADGVLIQEKRDDNDVTYVHTTSHVLPRYIPLSGELGFAIGFILAEGFLSYHSNKYSRITFNNKNMEDVQRVAHALKDIGCVCTINERNDFICCDINNLLFIYILKIIMQIKSKSRHKNLPVDILNYNLEFIKGIIAGVIDGDGNQHGTGISLRISSRTMIEQIALLLQFIGIIGRDRRVEGQGSTREYKGRIIKQNYPMYGLSFRIREIDLPSTKYRNGELSTKHWRAEATNAWSKVVNNLPVNTPDDYIYDITTDSHTLLVNGMYNHNCCGYSLKNVITMGVQGVPNIPTSAPAKHFDSILNQLANLITVYQNEIAGL